MSDQSFSKEGLGMFSITKTGAVRIDNGKYMTFPVGIVLIGIVAALKLFKPLDLPLILYVVLLIAIVLLWTFQNRVEFDPVKGWIHDYWSLLWIKVGNEYDLNNYHIVTVLPIIERGLNHDEYEVSSNFEIYICSENFRRRRPIAKYKYQAAAVNDASILAEYLELRYFEYNPKLVREVLRGEKTI